MSTQITTSFVEQYSSNVQMLSQQMGSKLRGAVDVETIRGKNAFFDQIGATAAVARTTRHGDTPQVNTPHSRRRVSLADYEWADLIDDLDKVRIGAQNPNDQFIQTIDVTGSLGVEGTLNAGVVMNPQTQSANIVIPTGYNASMQGPVHIASNVVVWVSGSANLRIK